MVDEVHLVEDLLAWPAAPPWASGMIAKSMGFGSIRCQPTYKPVKPAYSRYQVFAIVKDMAGDVIAAGGSVLATVELFNRGYRFIAADNDTFGHSNFTSSDMDLYVRANDAEAARAITMKLIAKLKPFGLMVRSEFAISFHADSTAANRSVVGAEPETIVKDHGNIKVQIISHCIPHTCNIEDDISKLFASFDLDCCKWAMAPGGIYASDSAILALTNRICFVRYDKLSDSVISRMARYARRAYDFEVVKLVDSEWKIMHYPAACIKIRETLSGSIDTLIPDSGYIQSRMKPTDDVLFQQMQRYGANNEMPHMIVVEPEEAVAIVYGGKQSSSFFWSWRMETMNKMCEASTWFACESRADREDIQKIGIRSIAAWERVVKSMDLGPMFSSTPKYRIFSDETRARYWSDVPITPTI